MKHTLFSDSQQRVYRIGKVVLKQRGAEGIALCPIEVQAEGAWQLSGVLRLSLRDCAFQFFPKSRRERKRLVRAAVRRTNEVLARVA